MAAIPDPTPSARQGTFELCGVTLRGPVLNGSGTFDAIAARRAFGDALLERFPFDAFVSKTITLEPRQGNPPPRLWKTPAGMINSIGLPNKGLDGFLALDLPELAQLPVPLVVSATGFWPRRARVPSLAAGGGARRGGAAGAERVLPECGDRPDHGRGSRQRPPWRWSACARVDGEAADREAHTQRHRPGDRGGRRGIGGRGRRLAGEHAQGHGSSPLRPASRGSGVAPAACRDPRSGRSRSSRWRRWRVAWQIPVIGMGGIASGRHAADFMAAGASAVAVGTEKFPRSGRGATDCGRAGGAVPLGQARHHRLDRCLRPFGGHERARSAEDAATFRHLRGKERFCS